MVVPVFVLGCMGPQDGEGKRRAVSGRTRQHIVWGSRADNAVKNDKEKVLENEKLFLYYSTI